MCPLFLIQIYHWGKSQYWSIAHQSLKSPMIPLTFFIPFFHRIKNIDTPLLNKHPAIWYILIFSTIISYMNLTYRHLLDLDSYPFLFTNFLQYTTLLLLSGHLQLSSIILSHLSNCFLSGEFILNFKYQYDSLITL